MTGELCRAEEVTPFAGMFASLGLMGDRRRLPIAEHFGITLLVEVGLVEPCVEPLVVLPLLGRVVWDQQRSQRGSLFLEPKVSAVLYVPNVRAVLVKAYLWLSWAQAGEFPALAWAWRIQHLVRA